MDGIKLALLTPEIHNLDDSLGNVNCFHTIEHKRDITLSLKSGDDENKNSKYIGDQTPTPTRLIRNCEEFGLFDDLKHVNPFEETFRQAIDSGKSKRPSGLSTTRKSLEVIQSKDEDLHTPNIVPYNIITGTECQAETENKSNVDKQSGVIPVIISNESVKTDPPVISNNDECSKSIVDCKEGLWLSETNKTFEKTKYKRISPKPALLVSSSPMKEKIRESLLKLRTTVPVVNIHITSTKPADIRDIPKDEIRRQVLKRSIAYQDNGTNERNREAAKRYRHKQKMLHDALLQRNAQLEAENTMLKKQLQLFRKAHENCSVSLH